ncbi:MAG TPA: aldo/keto reductase [Acetobacteraceae bacterium]|nr:aldo/keto reductase [Acetobacteraceae bacterium]
MITRTLGRTGIPVTTLGFGSTGLGNLYRAQTEDVAMATVDAAYAAGIRYFDNAPLYGYGLAEHRLGAALRRLPGEIVLSTKAGWRLFPSRLARGSGSGANTTFQHAAPFKPRIDYSYDGIMRSFEDSIQRLGTDRIDILLLHDCDRRNHGDAYPERFKEAMAGAYPALLSLREQGAVRAIGAGLNEWEACQDFATAGDFDCFLLAGRYTLLDQSSLTSFLPLCVERGIGIILGGPYNSGILATGPVEGAFYDYAPAAPEILERTRAIEAVCTRHGVPLRAAALQFPLSHPAVATVIPGARDPGEVDDNIRLAAHPIPRALWTDLATAGLLRADAVPPA